MDGVSYLCILVVLFYIRRLWFEMVLWSYLICLEYTIGWCMELRVPVVTGKYEV
jgi:hypothetical protein